jgi:hypothetical protein
MAELQHMPPIIIPPEELFPFGHKWKENGNCLARTPPLSSMELTYVFDKKIGSALAGMLGNIPVVELTQNNTNPPLIPAIADCVEVGPCRVIGGIRPQNFDVGYRPDGIRIAFDSKTLNDKDSVKKNYQNMINDLGAEASSVHSRFPYAVVSFLVAIPTPCLLEVQKRALTSSLNRLTGRNSPVDVQHKAEAIAFVLWEPTTGQIDPTWPHSDSPLRIEALSKQIETAYVSRYQGLPPHH